MGVNPKTVNVTLPWKRLFEVYVDVRPTAHVSLESDVRQKIKNKELKRLAAQVEEAQKFLSMNVNAAEKEKSSHEQKAEKMMQSLSGFFGGGRS